MRPHDPLKHDRRALPLDRLPRLKRPDDGALEPLREQRRRRRPQRVHDAETVRVAAVVRRGRAHDAVDARFVRAPREERERLPREQGGGQSAGARDGARGQVAGVFDGDPGVRRGVQGLEARGVADDEGEHAEVLVLLGVDFGRRGARAVVAEHADEGRGAVGGGEGGAGGDEGGEDVGGEVEGGGDGGGDVGEEGAGEVPGGLEVGLEGRGTVGCGLDCHDAFLVGDLGVAFFGRGGAAGGLVVCLFGGVGGQVEEFGGLGEELGVRFDHAGVVC